METRAIGSTFDESGLDMLGPNEIALLVFLSGATFAEAGSTDRLSGLGSMQLARSVRAGSGVAMRGFGEGPEPRKIALYAAERAGGRNGGVVETGTGTRRGTGRMGRVGRVGRMGRDSWGVDAGVCEWRIEVEDILRGG